MYRIVLCVLLTFPLVSNAQDSWTDAELAAANTGKDVKYLDEIEKDALMYINLARLYPRKFAKIELADYNGTEKYGDYLKDSPYKKSLIKTLAKLEPMEALVPTKEMSENAQCFAKELGESGRGGHDRKKCEKRNWAECVSVGMANGKDVAMQLLIDHDVPSMGHRKICLDPKYTKTGLGFYPHKKWGECLVMEVI